MTGETESWTQIDPDLIAAHASNSGATASFGNQVPRAGGSTSFVKRGGVAVLNRIKLHVFCILVWLLGSSMSTWATVQDIPAKGLNILMFNSFDAEAPFFQSVAKGFKETLKTTPGPVTIYYEHLDATRFPPAQNPYLVDHLRTKYRDTPIDFVVTMSQPAFVFVHDHPDLVPQARRVHADVGENPLDESSENISIVIGYQYRNSIDEMLRLVKPKQVYVIGDTLSPDGSQ